MEVPRLHDENVTDEYAVYVADDRMETVVDPAMNTFGMNGSFFTLNAAEPVAGLPKKFVSVREMVKRPERKLVRGMLIGWLMDTPEALSKAMISATSAVASPSRAYNDHAADFQTRPPLPVDKLALMETLSHDPINDGTDRITFGLTAFEGGCVTTLCVDDVL